MALGFTVALSTLASACGSDTGKRTVRECPAECPEERCDQETGMCIFVADVPEGGAGGAGGEAGEPEPVMPEGGAGGQPSVERDEVSPVVAITNPSEGDVLGPDVSFDFEADEPVTYRCFLNEEALEECAPGMTLVDLLSGQHTFSVVATDEAGNESEIVEVTFVVNRGPTIGDIAEIVTPEDVGTGALPFAIGDEDNSAEDLIVTATLDGELPIPSSGVLLGGSGAERTITLDPALNAFGSAVLTLEVSDGFVSTSRQVPITVTPVNDPPQIQDVPDKRVAEDSVLGPEAFYVSDVETPADQLVVTAMSGNTTRIPNNAIVLGGSGEERTFTITPAAQQTGTATVTLTVSDGELSDSDPFVVTLASSDDAPTISAIANQTTAEDTAKTVNFTVGDPDTALASLTPSASFAANGVVQSVSFGGTGANRTLTVTPKPNQSGSALISVTISDASGGVSTSFTLTVTPVNDAPTVNGPANQAIDEDESTGSLSFTVADIDSGTLSVTAGSSNTTLIPNANIVVAPVSGAPGTRSVTVTPAANRNGGPVTITLTASDGSLTGTDAFTVTVNASNDAPTISGPANQAIDEDETTGALTFSVADIDSATLTVTASSNNTTLIPNGNVVVAPASGAPGDRTVTVTPAADGHGGPVTITLQVSDGSLSASDTFTVTVSSVNDPPTISNITNRTVEPDTSTGAIAFTIGDPDGDALTVSASSSVTRVAPNANLTLGGSGNSRTLTVVPGSNQGGASTITVQVSDGDLSASDTFVLSVKVALTGVADGKGTVTASGTGCPGGTASCAALPGAGTVTFVASPDAGAVFNGWSGACSGTGSGVVTPIPTAGVTCTAKFTNLWARLFYTPDDAPKQLETNAVAVVETSKSIRYLGNRVAGNSNTSVVWNADPLTGQVVAGTPLQLIAADGSNMPGVDIATDPAVTDGTVVLVSTNRNKSGLVWLSDENDVNDQAIYLSPAGTDSNGPTGLLRNLSGGLTFVESSHNTSPVAVFPTYAHLVRVDATGAPIGTTRWVEATGPDCTKPASFNNVLAPRALAQNSDGNYLVVSFYAAGDPPSYRMNLTLLDKDGVPQWGRRIVSSTAGVHILPVGMTANGTSFVVSGGQSDAGGAFDGFALSITGAGAISWAKTWGTSGVNDVAARGALGGAGVVITGYASQSGFDVFAGLLAANGSTLTGFVYGGTGNDSGLAIARSATGFNLFGGSASGFGQTAPSSWALRVDNQLQIVLETGTVAAYAPALTNMGYTLTNTCVLGNTGVYTTHTPTREAFPVSPQATTVGGPYQANP